MSKKHVIGFLMAIVIFSGLSITPVSATTLSFSFSDGFESDSFNTPVTWTSTSTPTKWDTKRNYSQNTAHSGSYRAITKGSATNDFLAKATSTVGYENIVLSYWYKVDDALSSLNHVVTEWSNDGGLNWNQLFDLTNVGTTTWTQNIFNLPTGVATPNADNAAGFQFRFRSTLSSGKEVGIDDVLLTGTPMKGSIVVHENVLDPDDNEIIDNHLFTAQLNGANDATVNEDTDVTFNNLPFGSYTITALADADYDFVSITPDSDALTDGAQITLLPGETIEIFLVNKQKKAVITVTKNVVRFDGGEIDDDQPFSVTINGETKSAQESQSAEFNVNPGTYSASEDLEAGYEPDSNDGPVTAGSNGQATITLVNRQLAASVRVLKVADPSNAGSFTFQLDNSEGSFTSDAIIGSGNYTFNNLIPGDYVLSELPVDGWAPSDSPNCVDTFGTIMDPESFTIAPGDAIDCTFNNTQLGSISGMKWHDVNADGIRDNSELGVQDVVIFLDDNFDEEFSEDEEEMSAWTDENGMYSFTNLMPGDYSVCELVESGWVRSYPNEDSDCQTVTVTSDGPNQNNSNINFGNYHRQAISGLKFEDTNGNGVRDEGELALSGWEIKLYDSSENEIAVFSTDGDGNYSFADLMPGTYIIRETSQTGWVQTMPAGGEAYIVILISGEDQIGKDFGNRHDTAPAQSALNNLLNHAALNKTGQLLNIVGTTTDDLTGVASAELLIHIIGGSESVINYPDKTSFFDVFMAIECRNISSPISTEIISLSLTSVDPLIATWSHNWLPTANGTYCFELRSTDNAGNTEAPVIFGPVAYAPVAQITNETKTSVTENSYTVVWETDHPATSRVIYDIVSHSILGDAPNYGYAFSSAETDVDSPVISHSVVIPGLAAGTQYFYRVVSVGSPASVGDEGTLTTDEPPAPEPIAAPEPNPEAGGVASGGGSYFTEPAPSEQNNNQNSETIYQNLAGNFASGGEINVPIISETSEIINQQAPVTQTIASVAEEIPATSSLAGETNQNISQQADSASSQQADSASSQQANLLASAISILSFGTNNKILGGFTAALILSGIIYGAFKLFARKL